MNFIGISLFSQKKYRKHHLKSCFIKRVSKAAFVSLNLDQLQFIAITSLILIFTLRTVLNNLIYITTSFFILHDLSC